MKQEELRDFFGNPLRDGFYEEGLFMGEEIVFLSHDQNIWIKQKPTACMPSVIRYQLVAKEYIPINDIDTYVKNYNEKHSESHRLPKKITGWIERRKRDLEFILRIREKQAERETMRIIE
jgi:hypothetical protein